MARCRHTPAPVGYMAWHEWAKKKAKTHRQERCPECRRWAIWRKRSDTGTEGGESGTRKVRTSGRYPNFEDGEG